MTTAVLCCDFQHDILSFLDEAKKTELIGRAKQILDAARSKNLLVIFIRVAFRSGYPEISPNNLMFSAVKQNNNLLVDGSKGADIVEALTPTTSDIVLTKSRVGSFSTTNLRTILTAQGVNHIVLFGVSTSGVVLTTVREAADMDYKITVISDASADRSDEVHKVLTGMVFPRQAAVKTTEEWIQSI